MTPAEELGALGCLLALLNKSGEVWGYVAGVAEETHADGSLGYHPTVDRNGREVWRSSAIHAGAPGDDAGLAKDHANRVALMRAAMLIQNELQADHQTMRRAMALAQDWNTAGEAS